MDFAASPPGAHAEPAPEPGSTGQAEPGSTGQETAQDMAVSKIHEIMFGGAFTAQGWNSLERFATEKAREARSARLKRGSGLVSPGVRFGETPQPRRVVYIKRRKQCKAKK